MKSSLKMEKLVFDGKVSVLILNLPFHDKSHPDSNANLSQFYSSHGSLIIFQRNSSTCLFSRLAYLFYIFKRRQYSSMYFA